MKYQLYCLILWNSKSTRAIWFFFVEFYRRQVLWRFTDKILEQNRTLFDLSIMYTIFYSKECWNPKKIRLGLLSFLQSWEMDKCNATSFLQIPLHFQTAPWIGFNPVDFSGLLIPTVPIRRHNLGALYTSVFFRSKNSVMAFTCTEFMVVFASFSFTPKRKWQWVNEEKPRDW